MINHTRTHTKLSPKRTRSLERVPAFLEHKGRVGRDSREVQIPDFVKVVGDLVPSKGLQPIRIFDINY